jgi:hypothetical protein
VQTELCHVGNILSCFYPDFSANVLVEGKPAWQITTQFDDLSQRLSSFIFLCGRCLA